MIERKVARYKSGEPGPLASWRRRLALANLQNAPALLHVDSPFADGSDKSRALFFPMKRLSGVEREREIEIWACNRSQWSFCTAQVSVVQITNKLASM